MGPEREVRLIAHRGGVVDETRPENSFSALAAAIDRGYWMVEIDIRRTSDGVFVIWHDAEMALAGTTVTIEETTWGEIRSNTTPEAENGDPNGAAGDRRRPPTLDEVLDRFAGRIRFMLDVKNRDHPPEVYPELEQVLAAHEQIQPSYFIGAPDGKEYFRGRAWTAGTFTSIEPDEWEAAANSKQFLFGHGAELTADIVNHAQQFGVPVVASVNLGHYPGLTEFDSPDLTAPRQDIGRLLDAGVTEFQIDSLFESFIGEAG